MLFHIADLDTEGLDKTIFIYLYGNKNLGMLITMILYKFYFLVPININIAVTGTILFFSSFILFGKIIGNMIRGILNYYQKGSREKRKKVRKLIKEKKVIKKQILEKEKQERIESERQSIVEKTVKKQREERILQLKKNMEKNKKILVEKQLKINGINLKEKKEKIDKKNKVYEIEKVTKGQLRFKFKKEEV
ncbi:MAG: hypothetical protein WBG30_14695 [Psychrilyobacter sp.]